MSDRRHKGRFAYKPIQHVLIDFIPNPDDDENYMIAERTIMERVFEFGDPLPGFPRFYERRMTELEDDRLPGGSVPVAFEVPAKTAVDLQQAVNQIDETAEEVERESLKVAKAQLEEQFKEAMKKGPGLWVPGQQGPGAPGMPGPTPPPGPLSGPFGGPRGL